jgi:hypothetical protein
VTTKIYLDIDGVLLGEGNNPAPFAHEFLIFVTSYFPTYWLTTHCRGDSIYTKMYLERTFQPDTLAVVKKVLPTEWRTNKTEAIDFSQPFLWFDDDLFEGEKKELVQHNVFANWIKVDLRKDINSLHNYLNSFPIPIDLV